MEGESTGEMRTEEGASENPAKPSMGPALWVESSLPGVAAAAPTPKVV